MSHSDFESLSCTSSFVDWEAEEWAAAEAEARALRGADEAAQRQRKADAKHDFTFRSDSESDSDDDRRFPLHRHHHHPQAQRQRQHPQRLAGGERHGAPAAATAHPVSDTHDPPHLPHGAVPARVRPTAAQVALQCPAPRGTPRCLPPPVAHLPEPNAPSPDESSGSFFPLVAPEAGHDAVPWTPDLPPLPSLGTMQQDGFLGHDPYEGTAPNSRNSSQESFTEWVGDSLPATVLTSRRLVGSPRPSARAGEAGEGAETRRHVPLRHPPDATITTSPPPRLSSPASSSASSFASDGFYNTDREDAEAVSGARAPPPPPPPSREATRPLSATSPDNDRTVEAAQGLVQALSDVLVDWWLRIVPPEDVRKECGRRWRALPTLSLSGAASLALLCFLVPVNLLMADVCLYRRFMSVTTRAQHHGDSSSSSSSSDRSHDPKAFSGMPNSQSPSPPFTPSSAAPPVSSTVSATAQGAPKGHSVTLLMTQLLWFMCPHGLLYRLWRSRTGQRYCTRLRRRLGQPSHFNIGAGDTQADPTTTDSEQTPLTLRTVDTSAAFVEAITPLGSGAFPSGNDDERVNASAHPEATGAAAAAGVVPYTSQTSSTGNQTGEEEEAEREAQETWDAVCRELTILGDGCCDTLALFLGWVWAHFIARRGVVPYVDFAAWTAAEMVVKPVKGLLRTVAAASPPRLSGLTPPSSTVRRTQHVR